MKKIRNRHYRLFLMGVFLLVITIMTLLCILTVFTGAFPAKIHSLFNAPKSIVLLFCFVPILLLFYVANFSTYFINRSFNLLFHHRDVIPHDSYIRLSNKICITLLRDSFWTFGLGLGVVIGCANRIFYWLRQGDFNFSNWLMAGTILCYVIALWGAYRTFVAGAELYIKAKLAPHNPIDDPNDPLVWERPENGTIQADEDGFSIINGRYGDDFICWNEIQEVRGYMRGSALDYSLQLNLFTKEFGWWKLRDDMVGYHNLHTWLDHKLLGFDPNWSEQILTPEFKRKHGVIWKRKNNF